MSDNIVRFAKLRTSSEPSFWSKFTELKIDKYKLDDKVKISLWGSFSLEGSDSRGNPLFLDFTSFNE